MLNHEIEIPFESVNQNQEVLRITKGTSLQRAGAINVKAYYVVKGLLRSYLIDEKGKEHTYLFAPEKWLIGDSYAYTIKEPSKMYIDAIEDSEVVVIDPTNINSEDTTLTIEEYKSELKKLSNRVGMLQNRILMQMSAPARVRYEHFVETYPQITQRVPLKMIATYLGITPEALSNVRSDWAKSK